MKEDEDIHPAYLEQVQKVALARAVQPGHGHDRDGALHRLQHAHGLVVHLELVRVRVDQCQVDHSGVEHVVYTRKLTFECCLSA